MISVNRYLAIVHPHKVFRALDQPRLKWLLATIWTINLLMATPIFIFEELTGFMIWKDDCNLMYFDKKLSTYYYTTICLYALLPGLLIPYLYARIFYSAVKSHTRVKPGLQRQHTTCTADHVMFDKIQFKLSMMLLLTYLCFLAIYLPYIVMLFIHITGNIHIISEDFAVAIYMLNFQGVVNPFIYGAMNMEFRKAYKQIIACTCCYIGS